MTQYVKIFVISLLLLLYTHATALDIEEIKNDFHTTVVLKPLYLDHYSKDLDSVCKTDDKECYSLKLAELMQKHPASEDAEILESLKKRDEKFIIDDVYWKNAQVYLRALHEYFFSSQFLTFIDLSKQVLIVVLWDNETKTFHPIGFDFISSGNMEKEIQVINGEDHYLKTPAGLFSIQSGWRSKGDIFEDNITMPYGDKDRFVFYFGKQASVRYNTLDEKGTKIEDPSKWQLITDELEFAIHAHQSSVSLGKPHSHGCIRMSNELNVFLDNNLVFFKYFYNEENEWQRPFTKPPADPKRYELAGEFMLIVDEL